MAPIKKDEVIVKDVLQNGIDSGEKLLAVLDKNNAEIKELTKNFEELSTQFGSQKGINSFIKSISEIDKAKKRAEKTDASRLKQTRELQKARIDELKLQKAREKAIDTFSKKEQAAIKLKQKARLEELALQKRREKAVDDFTKKEQQEIAAALKSKKVTIDSANAFKRLSRQVKNAKERLQRLAATYGVNDKRTLKAQKNFERLDNQLRKVNNTARNGRRDFRSLTFATEKLGNTLRKASSLAAQFGLAVGGVQLIRSSITSITDFGQSVADLSAITGATGEDLQFYKNQAIELGKTTKGGATQVVEAFKLIGSAKPELLENAKALNEVTEAAITLSKASGLDVPEAATRLTDAMNQFGAPAEQAGRFIDVLANGAKFGSAEIPQLTDALLKFGAVARTSNVSIEESTALIELLAENGQKGAEAGTGLRNVMLKLSAPDALPKEAQEMMKKLGISFEDISDPSKSFADRLKAMKPLLSDNAALQKVFGKENAVTAINLLQNTDRIDDLNVKMEESGTATEQAETRTKTLGEAFENIKRAWESFVLELADGGGMERLIEFLESVARNLPEIISWIGRLIKVFLAYKLVTSQTGIAIGKFGKALLDANGNIIKTVKNLKASAKATKEAKAGMEGGAKAAKGMGKALKSIGFAIAIELAIEFAMALFDIFTLSNQVRQAEEARAAGATEGARRSGEMLANVNKGLQNQLTLLEQIKNEEISSATSAKQKAAIEAKFLKDKEDLLITQKTVITDLANLEGRRHVRAILAAERSGKIVTDNQNKINIALASGNATAIQWANGLLTANLIAEKAVSDAKAAIDAYGPAIGEVDELLQGLGSEQRVQANETAAGAVATHSARKAQRRINTEFSTTIALVSELNELFKTKNEQELASESISRESELSDLDRLIDKKKEEIALNIEFAQNAEQVDQETTGVTDAINQRRDLEIEGIMEVREFDITSAENAHTRKFIDMREALKKERIELLAQKDINEDEIAAVEANFKLEKDKLDELEIAAEQALQGEIVNINAQAQADIHELDENALIEKEAFLNEVNDLEIAKLDEIQAARDEARKKELEAEKQHRKEIADLLQESGEQIIDGLINVSKADEELIDEEIANSQKLEDELKESAKNGNAIASESLAAQENFTKERIRAKEAEQRKQQALEDAKLAIQFIAAFVEGGDNPIVATGKGIAQTKIVQRLVEGLSGLFGGTETTVANELGAPLVAGKDGYVVRLDGQEKVLNPALSAMTGNATTDSIVDGYLYSQAVNNGMLVSDYKITANASISDFGPLERKIDVLTNVLRGKKETTISKEVELGIAKGLVRTEREGGKTTRTYLRG